IGSQSRAISELPSFGARQIDGRIWIGETCLRNPNGASLSVARSEPVNQLGCPRGSAFVFVQRCMRIFHQTLARLAVAEKLANSALERLGIVNLHCGVI